MKKLLSLFAFVVIATSAMAQTYADRYMHWNVLEFNTSLGPDDFYAQTYIFVAYEDTTIADKAYSKIGRYWSLEPEKREYVAAIRQQGDSLMVHYEHTDYLLCDFGVKVGDEREVFVGINNWGSTLVPTNTYKNKVTDVIVLPDGRKEILVDIYWGDKNSEDYEWCVHSGKWIEGVGDANGLLYTGSSGGRVGGGGYALLCASDVTKCIFTSEDTWLSDFGCVYNHNSDLDTVAPQMHEGHAYVDLGLPSGTLWATCNIGASVPEGVGDHFAWGETSTKEDYSWSTYKYGTYNDDEDFSELTKYNSKDKKTTLDASDDAATVHWGGVWRMPTREEVSELFRECTNIWTYKYNATHMAGRIFVGKNGNSIFLPTAGHRIDSNLYEVGATAFYWTSSLVERYPIIADYLYFSQDFLEGDPLIYRNDGLSVRPVLSPNSHTAVENVGQTEPINAHKVMENGQLVIIRDGVRYNVLGARL